MSTYDNRIAQLQDLESGAVRANERGDLGTEQLYVVYAILAVGRVLAGIEDHLDGLNTFAGRK